MTASHSSSPSDVDDGASAPVAFSTNPSTLVPSRSVTPRLVERLVDRLGDVRIEHLGEHPRALVDEVDLQAAVAERAGHLDAERRRADDRHPLHPVELLVEHHRRADVLDVVQAFEVRARARRASPT